MRMPRVAIFTDSYHEANPVARTSKALEACAKRRGMPLLSVHAGPETRLLHDGSNLQLDLKRSLLASFWREDDVPYDLAMWRYLSRVKAIVKWFAPDVLHLTGPSDVGQLGAYLGHRLSIPMVASWHSNFHQFGPKRFRRLFYRLPHVILAPNNELQSFLERETGKPTVLMPNGVDTNLFTPARRRHPNWLVNIGYVGRVSADNNVHLLQSLEDALDAEGLDVRFTIVGEGNKREWLEKHMKRAEFTGVLHGGELATAYAEMDILACPAETDVTGSVVLEAMASGVPVVAMDAGFIESVRSLVRNRAKREALGAAARARALELSSWDRIFHDICQAYGRAILAGQRQSA